MEKSRFPRGYKVYLPLVLLFALLVFVMPRSPKFNYDYRKGALWMYEDFVSQFDFPLLKSEEQSCRRPDQASFRFIVRTSQFLRRHILSCPCLTWVNITI